MRFSLKQRYFQRSFSMFQDHLEAFAVRSSVFVDRIPVEEGVPQQTSVGLSKALSGAVPSGIGVPKIACASRRVLSAKAYIPRSRRRSSSRNRAQSMAFSVGCAGAWPSRTAAAG